MRIDPTRIEVVITVRLITKHGILLVKFANGYWLVLRPSLNLHWVIAIGMALVLLRGH